MRMSWTFGDVYPRDIDHKTVYLIFRGAQLYIYLISKERRQPDQPAMGPAATDYRSTIQIYPDKQVPR